MYLQRYVALSAILFLLTNSAFASPKRTKPLSLRQQLAAKNAIIADLGEQIHRLNEEITNLRSQASNSSKFDASGVASSVTTRGLLTAPINSSAPSVITDLNQFDQMVKECDHMLWLVRPLTKAVDDESAMVAILDGQVQDDLNQGNLAEAQEMKNASDKELSLVLKNKTQIASYLSKSIPLSRSIHASSLFNKYYFIGDNVVPEAWLDHNSLAMYGVSNVTDNDVRYIESSKPGLGRPQSELSISM